MPNTTQSRQDRAAVILAGLVGNPNLLGERAVSGAMADGCYKDRLVSLAWEMAGRIERLARAEEAKERG